MFDFEQNLHFVCIIKTIKDSIPAFVVFNLYIIQNTKTAKFFLRTLVFFAFKMTTKSNFT